MERVPLDDGQTDGTRPFRRVPDSPAKAYPDGHVPTTVGATVGLYRDLSDSEIRVIKIIPGNSNDIIECKLEYMKLEHDISYVALSYAWGDPTDTEPIILNGQSISIVRSLYSALWRLREFYHETESARPTCFLGTLQTFRLWADAICVNQADLSEKSSQIPQMRDIYSSASSVCIWLGENGDEEEMVCRVFHNLQRGQYPGVAFVSSAQNSYAGMVDALCRILKRPWFSRLWVVQEATLSRRTPVFLAGRYWADFESLMSFHDHLLKIPWDHNLPNVECFHGQLNRLSLHIHARCSFQHVEEPNNASDETYICDMERLLSYTAHWFEASVAHDRIYAIIGLAQGANLWPQLAPDYQKPFANVAHAYCKEIVKTTRNLSILTGRQTHLEGVPTWVPDFRCPVDKTKSPLTQADVAFSEDGHRLTVSGVKLGTAIRVHPALSNPVAGKVTADDLRNFYQLFETVSALRRVPIDRIIDDWCRIGPDIRTDSLATNVANCFDAAVKKLPFQLKHSTSSNELEKFLYHALQENSTFVTDSGDLSLHYTRDTPPVEGDVLVIPRGSTRPYLLRPTEADKLFSLVRGYTGMHKTADGQEFDDTFFSRQELRSFTLV